MPKPAVLLLNLGSPDSTSVPDVKRYLREFLGDERVIDKPASAFLRSVLVNGIIIPSRAKNSAHAYSTIWTAEGSPLIVTSKRTQAALQKRVELPVALAMNYGQPSIPDVLRSLAAQGVDHLLLFPQYPHRRDVELGNCGGQGAPRGRRHCAADENRVCAALLRGRRLHRGARRQRAPAPGAAAMTTSCSATTAFLRGT